MESPALPALSVLLSIWGLQRALFSLIIDNTHITLSSQLLFVVFAVFTLKVNHLLIGEYLFKRRARALGCGTAAVYPHKDPILGLDIFVEAKRAFKNHKLLDLYSSQAALCGKTYYILALGRWLLATNEVENVKTMLSTKMADWPIAGPRLLSVLPVLGPNSIFTSNGEAWHTARALIRPSFVRDQVADFRCFDRHIRNMLAAIPADGTTFDMQNLLLNMTMDSTTDFLLGYSTNLLTKASPEAQQFVRDFEYASRQCSKKSRLGTMLYHIPHPKLERAVRGLREYVRVYLQRAITAKGEGKSRDRNYVFLDELLKASPPEDYTIDQILSILIAGRDTTATAMSSVFYFLSRAPAAMEKLRQEINNLDTDDPTWEQLKQIKYLHSIIKECKSAFPPSPPLPPPNTHPLLALRLFTPVSTNSRTAATETVLPRGGGPDGRQPVLIPKGTTVRWSNHALHRDPAVFGADADAFRPERWEEGGGLRVK
jgi:cytochrome P450